jgi:GAF domain
MPSSSSWQKILQRIIRTSAEAQRLAAALGVSAMTLKRWTNESSRPQRTHLIHLVQTIHPKYRDELLEALEVDYPEIRSWIQEEAPEQISSDFFAQVLQARATIIESLRFYHLCDMVLRQALTQLDSNRLGMSITLVQCMPPSENGKIRSLRERMGRGTLPWTPDLEQLSIFLGMESLAGYVVQYRRPATVEDLSKDHFLPAYQTEFEVSAAAYPITLEGRVAGCLQASSTQVGYFSQQRLALLGTFCDIISLAFDREDFYPPSIVQLRLMPPQEEQRPYLATFRRMVTQEIIEASHNHHQLTNTEAEQKVWSKLEEKLLNLVY